MYNKLDLSRTTIIHQHYSWRTWLTIFSKANHYLPTAEHSHSWAKPYHRSPYVQTNKYPFLRLQHIFGRPRTPEIKQWRGFNQILPRICLSKIRRYPHTSPNELCFRTSYSIQHVKIYDIPASIYDNILVKDQNGSQNEPERAYLLWESKRIYKHALVLRFQDIPRNINFTRNQISMMTRSIFTENMFFDDQKVLSPKEPEVA